MQLTYNEIIEKISEISNKLRAKGFKEFEVADFWQRFIKNIPKIKEVGVENIKVCTGCGRLNIEEVDPKYLACCPDNSYKNIVLKESEHIKLNPQLPNLTFTKGKHGMTVKED